MRSEIEEQVDEARLKAVEEAVIKIGNVIEIVIVDIKERLKVLEDHDKAFIEEVNTSCTLKDKQITEGDNKVFWKTMTVTSGLFLMFVGAVVYFNGVNGDIYEKVNDYHTQSVATAVTNSTNIINVLDELKEIKTIIKDNSRHTHTGNNQ